MGFTFYVQRYNKLEKWDQVMQGVKRLASEFGAQIVESIEEEEEESRDTRVIVNEKQFEIHGQCESLEIYESGCYGGDFCKTQEYEYSALVAACLILVKTLNEKRFVFNWDGESVDDTEQLQDGIQLYEKCFEKVENKFVEDETLYTFEEKGIATLEWTKKWKNQSVICVKDYKNPTFAIKEASKKERFKVDNIQMNGIGHLLCPHCNVSPANLRLDKVCVVISPDKKSSGKPVKFYVSANDFEMFFESSRKTPYSK